MVKKIITILFIILCLNTVAQQTMEPLKITQDIEVVKVFSKKLNKNLILSENIITDFKKDTTFYKIFIHNSNSKENLLLNTFKNSGTYDDIPITYYSNPTEVKHDSTLVLDAIIYNETLFILIFDSEKQLILEKFKINNKVFIEDIVLSEDSFATYINYQGVIEPIKNDLFLIYKNSSPLSLYNSISNEATNLYFDETIKIKDEKDTFKTLNLEKDENRIVSEIHNILLQTKKIKENEKIEYLGGLKYNHIYFVYRIQSSSIFNNIEVIRYDIEDKTWLIGETIKSEINKEMELQQNNFSKWREVYEKYQIK